MQKRWSEKILDEMNANKSAAFDGTARRLSEELAPHGLGFVWNTKWEEWTIRPIEEVKPYDLTDKELEKILGLLKSEVDFCRLYSQDLLRGKGIERYKVQEILKGQAQVFNRWVDYLK